MKSRAPQAFVTLAAGRGNGELLRRSYFAFVWSPNSLPVELCMKCVLPHATQTTGEWLSFASSGASASQCCTFIPVWGHLNRIC